MALANVKSRSLLSEKFTRVRYMVFQKVFFLRPWPSKKKLDLHPELFALKQKLNLSLFQDLRSKNRKAMEALNDMEQKYVKLLKTQQT